MRGLEQEPEGGRRCEKCFALRLDSAAQMARDGGYDYFTTTLTISPLKNARMLNEIGAAAGETHGVKWLYSDFKKRKATNAVLFFQRNIFFTVKTTAAVFFHAVNKYFISYFPQRLKQ